MRTSDVVIVGGGHSGMAVSYLLTQRGISHIVAERNEQFYRWRHQRWDSFTLLTPNWANWLPGWHYNGTQPHGFMNLNQLIDYFTQYAKSFGPPIVEGLSVRSVDTENGGFLLQTSQDEVRAKAVVVAIGQFEKPRIPQWATNLSPEITQMHSSTYKRADDLPPGGVLVVGSGASGQQIADDLHRAGRSVWLAVGPHARVPRRYRGRDYYWWLERGGYHELTADDVPPRQRRAFINPVLTGVGGGYTMDVRRAADEGINLLGLATGGQGTRIQFADDLAESLRIADNGFRDFINFVESRLDRFPDEFDEIEPFPTYSEFGHTATSVDLANEGISTIVWAMGFVHNFTDCVKCPVFDDFGYPLNRRGVTPVNGLYFMGLPWQHRLRSPFIRGAEEDARYVVDRICDQL